MSAIEVQYRFGDRVSGTIVMDLTAFAYVDKDSPMWEDEVVELVKDAVLNDLESGVVIDNLDAVVHWVGVKLEEANDKT